MKTKIFKSVYEFSHRDDKNLNGVSQLFADANPGWDSQNETNVGCWNCTGCTGCHKCFECRNCFACFDCYNCSECVHCAGILGSSDMVPQKTNHTAIPVIQNVHQTVLAKASATGALDMSDWHTCDTTHCRAGWVVHLAGEAGYDLEQRTSTMFAAMQIYKASSPILVSPSRFHESNNAALADMKRCAEEEAAAMAKA